MRKGVRLVEKKREKDRYTDRFGNGLSLLGGVSDLTLGHTNTVLRFAMSDTFGTPKKRDFGFCSATEGVRTTRADIPASGDAQTGIREWTGYAAAAERYGTKRKASNMPSISYALSSSGKPSHGPIARHSRKNLPSQPEGR